MTETEKVNGSNCICGGQDRRGLAAAPPRKTRHKAGHIVLTTTLTDDHPQPLSTLFSRFPTSNVYLPSSDNH